MTTDWKAFLAAVAGADQPAATLAALQDVFRGAVEARLFTVMIYQQKTGLASRIHTSHPERLPGFRHEAAVAGALVEDRHRRATMFRRQHDRGDRGSVSRSPIDQVAGMRVRGQPACAVCRRGHRHRQSARCARLLYGRTSRQDRSARAFRDGRPAGGALRGGRGGLRDRAQKRFRVGRSRQPGCAGFGDHGRRDRRGAAPGLAGTAPHRAPSCNARPRSGRLGSLSALRAIARRRRRIARPMSPFRGAIQTKTKQGMHMSDGISLSLKALLRSKSFPPASPT